MTPPPPTGLDAVAALTALAGAGLEALGSLATAAYAAAGLVLAGLGLHALVLAALRVGLPRRPLPTVEGGRWPDAVVQIPVYEEPPALVARALDAALALDYPGRVEVQLLDDSGPAARRANAALVAARRSGLDASRLRHLPRAARDGFKAGALAHGLRQTRAEVAAVFDVDFRPPPRLLRRLVGPLRADPGLAFVQARWAHPGAEVTWLGRAQAAVLDLHFAVEQGARDRAGLPLVFNGSGGAWRVEAIEAAGGWDGATLAEDSDLALRAQALGWRARLVEATVPADLPGSVAAWRKQQARWAKGLAEVARLRGATLWRSGLPLRSRLAFSGHLALSLSTPALLTLLALHPVAAALGARGVGPGVPAVLGVGWVALGGIVGAHLVASRALYPATWRRRLLRVPAALALPVALVVPVARAVAEGVVGRRTAFSRTPKGLDAPAESGGVEAGLAAYSLAGLALLVGLEAWGPAAFQLALSAATAAAAVAVRSRPRPEGAGRAALAPRAAA